MSVRRLILLLFIVTQVCDGLFTYVAVSTWGAHAEANVLLATWMSLVGPAAALAGAKLIATGCGVLLYVRRIDRPLAMATMLYAGAAVLPWLIVFQTR